MPYPGNKPWQVPDDEWARMQEQFRREREWNQMGEERQGWGRNSGTANSSAYGRNPNVSPWGGRNSGGLGSSRNYNPGSRFTWQGDIGSGEGGRTPYMSYRDFGNGQRMMRSSMGGGFGGGGGPEWQPYEGSSYAAPKGWSANEADVPGITASPIEAIEKARHWIDEEMEGGMADTARKFGASGALQSGGYITELGGVERKAKADLEGLAFKEFQDAERYQREKEAMERQNALDRSLSAWGTQGGWEHQGGMADQDRNFQAWAQRNPWELARYRAGLAGQDQSFRQQMQMMQMPMFA